MNEKQVAAPDNLKAILHELDGMEASVLELAQQSIDRTNQETIGHIVEKKLSVRGPKTLGRVTSRLARDVNATPATVSGKEVQSSIGTDVEYAAIHEYGFKGPVAVRAHQRRQPAWIFGKPNPKHGELVAVRSHQRKLDVPARRMIGTGLDEREQDYFDNLQEDLEASLNR